MFNILRKIVPVAALCLLSTQGEASRWYVNQAAAPGGDGSSWGKAFQDLQSALDAANAPGADEIWIAKGNYVPTKPDNGYQGLGRVTFRIPNQTSVYGGFEGKELSVADRKLKGGSFETVLNADVLGNDVPYGEFKFVFSAPPIPPDFFPKVIEYSNPNYLPNKKDNAYHVLLIGDYYDIPTMTTASLDGLTLKNAFAYDTVNLETFGGGMLVVNSDVTIKNVIIKDNNMLTGGAISAEYSKISISDSVVNNNIATLNAAGLEIIGNPSVLPLGAITVDNVSFSGNISLSCGDIWTRNNVAKIRNSSFEKSYSEYSTPNLLVAVQNAGRFLPGSEVKNNVFSHNKGLDGGSVELLSTVFATNSAPAAILVEGNTFQFNENDSSRKPDGLVPPNFTTSGALIVGNMPAFIKNNKFFNNSGEKAGAISVTKYRVTNVPIAEVTLQGNEFNLNHASNGGGAVIVDYGQKAFMLDNKFFNNVSEIDGGAVSLLGNAYAVIKGNTFNINKANGLGDAIFGDSTVTVVDEASLPVDNNFQPLDGNTIIIQ